MKMTIKDVLIFAGGLLAGIGAGVLATKKYFEKRSNDMVEEIRGYYQEEASELRRNAVEATRLYMDTVYGPPPSEAVEAPQKPRETPFTPPPYISYHKRQMSDDVVHAWEPEDEEEEDTEDLHPEDKDEEYEFKSPPEGPDEDPPPFTISYAEYSHPSGLYLQEALYLHTDGVVTNEDDEIVDRDLIGEENLKILEEGHEKVIYVRNVECGLEWEIEVLSYSYEDYIKGAVKGPKDG